MKRPESQIEHYGFMPSNEECLQTRIENYAKIEGPVMGDWVLFSDGTSRRISHIWEKDKQPSRIQTSDGNGYGFHMFSDGHCSYSGNLYSPVDFSKFKLTRAKRIGLIWFFSQDHPGADRGVGREFLFKVWKCDALAPEA